MAPSTKESPAMLDYLFILLDARRARLDERGASAVEYGLLIAGIAALIVAIVFIFGGVLSNIFSGTCTSIGNSAGVGGC
jgi:pilus assembly protein Flp/PilA